MKLRPHQILARVILSDVDINYAIVITIREYLKNEKQKSCTPYLEGICFISTAPVFCLYYERSKIRGSRCEFTE